jgi:hypothetical protein
MKRLFKYLKKLFAIYSVSGSIWLLYRIEDGKLKTYGYYTDYDRAVLWSESGKYSIVECKTWG